jgi:hypothetical protein
LKKNGFLGSTSTEKDLGDLIKKECFESKMEKQDNKNGCCSQNSEIILKNF